MANLNTQGVVGDTGSEEVATLRRNYNELCDVVGDLVTALKGVAAIGDVATAGTNAETAMEANVSKVGQEPDVPAAPTRPPERPGTL